MWEKYCTTECARSATTTKPCKASSRRSPLNSSSSMTAAPRARNCMNALIFVDTNVFVYSRQTNEPFKQPCAARWVERLWKDQTGRTSVQVLNELYVTLTRK